MRRAKFFGIGLISTACVLVLLLAVGMGMFPGKAQAAWERHPLFVTFNDLSTGDPNSGKGIHDDDMDAYELGLGRGEDGFTSGYRDGTYPYTYEGNGTFEVTAWIRNPPGYKLVSNSFRVFISNNTACGQSESPRMVVLDFTSCLDVLAPGDNVYNNENEKAVAKWTKRNVPFSVNNKLPSLLKMTGSETLSGTDGYGGTTESDLKLWFGFVVPGLTPESINEERELRVDNYGCGLIVFWLKFDFIISAEFDGTLPPNPVDANLANKWKVMNTSPVTLEIEEKVLVERENGKGKAKEEWQRVPLAQYNMPFLLTMILDSEDSPAPKRYNTLPTLWGKIKAR